MGVGEKYNFYIPPVRNKYNFISSLNNNNTPKQKGEGVMGWWIEQPCRTFEDIECSYLILPGHYLYF